jgi:GTP-binding protein
MFVDRAAIRVKAGDGGRGCVAFRREKGVPHGGPSGGDGGRGGDVVLVADVHMRTLIDFQFRPEYKAGRGGHGEGSQCSGRDSEDLLVRVPPGTIVREKGGGVMADLVADGNRVVGARGGMGGRGNQHFATSRWQTPKWAEPGEAGEERRLELELRVLADAGLVGLPNAGKSLLLSKISAAHPKVANYPFTTREPQLGVVSLGLNESFVVADLPGLIEGAHLGAGLGHEFLRHISRTRVLVHLIDVGTELPVKDILKGYDTILAEIGEYDSRLLKRPRVVGANKMDMPGAEKRFEALARHAKKRGVKEVHQLSALTGKGVDRLVRAVQKALASAPVPELGLEEEPGMLAPRGVPRVRIVRDQRGTFLIRNKELEKAVARLDAHSKEDLRALQGDMTRLGVDEALARAGIKRGDWVRVGDLVFQYEP